MKKGEEGDEEEKNKKGAPLSFQQRGKRKKSST